MLRVYDSSGVIVNNARVKDLGFDVGQMVLRKADGFIGKIDKITAEYVHLLGDDGTLVRASSETFVEGRWRQHVAKPEAVVLEEWFRYSPLHASDVAASIVKGAVHHAMIEQYKEFCKWEKQMMIYIKPTRDVQVLADFKPRGLKIPVATPKVEIKPVGWPQSQGAIQIATYGPMAGESVEGYVVYILPYFALPKDGLLGGSVNPAWIMKTSSNMDDCNMEVVGSTAKKEWWTQSLNPHACKVAHLPVLKNSRALKAGESLVLFRPESAKTEEVEQLQPLAKRRKS